MTTAGTPAADFHITADLVQGLLAEQHRDLAHLPLTHAASGWDNELFRLGEELCVRLPRRAVAGDLLVNEQRWLPLLSSVLPLPAPVPIRLGKPGAGFPWCWSVVPWLRGTAADLCVLQPTEAHRLVEFLVALHRAAPPDAPSNPVRGCALRDRTAGLQPRIERVQAGTGLFGAEMRAAWEQSLAAPIDRAPTWIHGDLHPRNILVDAGLLSAVIDWGDMAAGDCATDLACIWMMLEGADHRARALQHYGRLSQHDISRARGWAILLGTVFVDTGLAGDRRFLEIGARTLRRVAEGP